MSKKRNIDTTVFEFEDDESPETEWRGMPEFNQPDNGAYKQIIVSFDDEEGMKRFSKLLGVSVGEKTKSIWYPPRERNNVVDLFYFDEDTGNPYQGSNDGSA
jgi:hypothetical protein